MISIEELENPIQEYPWGSYTAISDLLGQPSPSRNPQAELWMGAHPRASSMMTISGKTISLYELIKKYPGEILGKNVQKKFGASLPFLFKVLAAEKPLSIQVHPNIEQAKEGYEKETKKGIPLDSDERNYKDDNHKPECICAITDFWLLNGFRKISDIVSTFETLSNGMLADEILQLRKNNSMNGLKQFFKSLMSSSTEKKQTLINSIVANVEKRIDTSLSYQWIIELHNEYGKDIGILATPLLNLI